MTGEWHTLGTWVCNQAGWLCAVLQRREGATERLAMGRDVSGQEAITNVVTLTTVRRILWSPLWKLDYLQAWDVPCAGCKAESRARSQGRRGTECPEARLVRAALGCTVRGETVCAVEVRGSFLVAHVPHSWGSLCLHWLRVARGTGAHYTKVELH